jgi:hypothetical protein
MVHPQRMLATGKTIDGQVNEVSGEMIGAGGGVRKSVVQANDPPGDNARGSVPLAA